MANQANELFARFPTGHFIAQVKDKMFKSKMHLKQITNARFLESGGAVQYTVDNIDPTMCTHVLYSFALLDKSTFKIAIKDHLVDIDNQGYSKSVALKTQNPQLKVMISLGGWTGANDGSKKYAALIANDSNIDTFVSSVVDFLQLHHFDGLDLDYDYIPNAVVKPSFARLLVALSTAFSPKGYLLSLSLIHI